VSACIWTQLSPGQEAVNLLDGLKALESKPVDEIWPAVEELKKVHAGDVDSLKAFADEVYSHSGKTKLAGAAILFARKEASLQQSGQVALQQLARDAPDKAVRIAAIRLLRKPVLFDQAYITLNDAAQAAKKANDTELLIEATLALWELDNLPSIREPLRKLLEDPSIEKRHAAALALAETGYYEEPVGELLRAIAKEPSSRGKHARALLRAAGKQDAQEPPRAPAPPRPGGTRTERNGSSSPQPADLAAPDWAALLSEVEGLIWRTALNRERVSRRDLYTAALRGMVSVLDEYSAFQDPDDVRQVEASRLGTLWGLCADLVKPGKSAPLVVARSHRGGPAHDAGLRVGDRIHEVNGIKTDDIDRARLETITSPEGEGELHLLVSRRAWPEKRMVRVKRGQLQVPLIQKRMLPGRLGYIRMARVGPTSAADFEKALDELEAQGLDALVIDLRDNPGGNVKQAVRIVDLFVGVSELPILTEKSPARTTEWSASPGEKPRHPMAILVNRQTASAAEVIAGSLQDFERAFLVGETTFGKGVKQVSLTLPRVFEPLLGGVSRLLLTSGRLYLPLGRPIQSERPREGGSGGHRPRGIDPDIEVASTDDVYQGRQLTELLRVEFSAEMDEYVHQRFPELEALFAGGKLPDPAEIPGFEALYQSLGTRLSRSDVRYALRSLVRRRIAENGEEEPIGSHVEDRALQRAILELLRRLGRDPRATSDYQGLLEQESGPEPSRGE